MKEDVFLNFPELESSRLLLRQVRITDEERIFGLYSQAEVMKYRGAGIFESRAEACNLIKSFEEQFSKRDGIRWALVLKDKKAELIGTVGLKSIDWKHSRAEIGYELSPVLWNQNIMTEALECITRFSFQKLKLHSLEANIAPDHFASARVLEKNGFVKEAHFKENWYYKGWWDSVIYTLHNRFEKD